MPRFLDSIRRNNQPLEPTNGSGLMFDRIAKRYDALNRIMSLGIDISWRNAAINALQLLPGEQLLDISTGTGDFALQMTPKHPNVKVTGLDPSKGMLEIAKTKIQKQHYTTISLVQGDAQALPFRDASFDAISMAFGIRNVPNRLKALKEIHRILKPTGRAVILELSEPPSGTLQKLTKFYIRKVIPWVGGLISSSKEYDYLQTSIAAFPAPPEFSSIMRDCYLETILTESLTLGTCHLFLIRPM